MENTYYAVKQLGLYYIYKRLWQGYGVACLVHYFHYATNFIVKKELSDQKQKINLVTLLINLL